jgi:cytochrome c oxidase subunit 2
MAGTVNGKARRDLLAGGLIMLAATLILLWFVANLYFDRWGIGGFQMSPFLPYPVVSGPSLNYDHWLGLLLVYLAFGIPIAVVAIGEVFLVAWKWRARPGHPAPSDGLQENIIPTSRRGKGSRTLLTVNILVAVLLFSLAVYSLPINSLLLGQPPDPPNTLTVSVKAFQWGWTFIYPNGYSSTGSAILPTNEEIVFKVWSTDVMHDFAIPSLKVKVDAYPDHNNTAWTIIYQSGSYEVFCMELCGVGHAYMTATLTAEPQAQFAQWYNSTGTT